MNARVESIWRRGKWVVVVAGKDKVLWACEAEPTPSHHRHVLGLAAAALSRIRREARLAAMDARKKARA